MRSFVFRFDVDSHRCLRRGVPNLLELADRIGVRFTFHVHMGRATARVLAIRELVSGGRSDVTALSSSEKLGVADLVTLLVANPEVGAGSPEAVRGLVAAGHEVGLHGGRNHRRWQDHGAAWPAERLRDEMAWGLEQLRRAGVPAPAGFSSPAWQGSATVSRVAAELGFAYVADIHDPDRTGVLPANDRHPLPRPVTNLVGEPGGVGYLEWHRARGSRPADVRADVRARLGAAGDLVVAYDHPFWAGVSDLDLLESVVAEARDAGFEVRTLADVVAGR